MNPVIPSLKPLLENLSYVFTDEDRIKEIAPILAKEELRLPEWNEPVFIQDKYEKVVDFFFIGNSINFKYWMKEDGIETFETYYKGIQASAFGMWGCLKRALDNKIPVLDANFLAELSRSAAAKIFRGNVEIPMLDERVKILNEVGRALLEKYDGHFYNLVEETNKRAFSEDDEKGIVDLLVNNFPSFNDISPYKTHVLKFYKRAQLTVGMLYDKLREKFEIKDVDELTVFADYQLPRSLRRLGVIKCVDSLERKILNKELIEKDSKEEQEIRANTIYACDLLVKEINKYRKPKINALHLDYKLWSDAEFGEWKEPYHLTITTAY
ncbi:MAG: queuosine salvage family protein [Candidatus Aenigmarchaeota archaeon]|nr:queuosine salvage family protein [Candidatus Aenigmarchaeota archaeon]